MRGGRDFASRADYEAFLRALLRRRNLLRRERLAVELDALRPLPPRRLEAYTTEVHRVTRHSTVLVRGNFYSVPSQLIGERVEVRVFAEGLEVWYAGKSVERLPRLNGEGKSQINYRHVIHSLVRKPGAFAHYRYQQSLFPRLVFRVAYDWLREHCPQSADRQYLRLLELAAGGREEAVAESLRALLECGAALSFDEVRARASSTAAGRGQALPAVAVEPVALRAYDALLRRGVGGEVAA